MRAVMHCQKELIADLGYAGYIPDSIMMKWFDDHYSTSKHLLILYSIARGLNAKKIIEIGFGRSSFILARAAYENGGRLLTCDIRDFSYLLNDSEKKITNYIYGSSEELYKKINEGIDFAFLDYFSSSIIREDFCESEINKCISLMKQNGIIAIHDALNTHYAIHDVISKIKEKNQIELVGLPFNNTLVLIRKIEPSNFGVVEDYYIGKKTDIINDR